MHGIHQNQTFSDAGICQSTFNLACDIDITAALRQMHN